MASKGSIGIAVIALFTITLLIVPWGESAIPPTPAIKFINTTSGASNYTAMTYDDVVRFIAGSGMTITPDNSTRSVTFSSIGGSGGQNNTGANVGTGEASVYRGMSGTVLDFKKLKQGSGVTLTNGTDDITIAATGGSGEVNTASNTGSGALKLFRQKVGTDLQFKSITSGQGITVTNGTDTGTIETNFKTNSKTCSAGDFVSAYDNSTGTYTCTTPSGGTQTIVVLDSQISCTDATDYCTIFTIPVTAGNYYAIQVYLVQSSSGTATGVQNRAILGSYTNNGGVCAWKSPITSTTTSIDNLALSVTPSDTGETTSFGTTPTMVVADCGIKIDTSTDLTFQFQSETAGQAVVTYKPSYYTLIAR